MGTIWNIVHFIAPYGHFIWAFCCTGSWDYTEMGSDFSQGSLFQFLKGFQTTNKTLQALWLCLLTQMPWLPIPKCLMLNCLSFSNVFNGLTVTQFRTSIQYLNSKF